MIGVSIVPHAEFGRTIGSTHPTLIFWSFTKTFSAFAYPFYEPVDHVGLKLTDYLTIVKQPIDLGSVKRKLESDQYADYKDVHADVTLMFKNCYLYNPTTHSVVKMAIKLEQIAEKRLDLMVTRRFFSKIII